MMSVSLLLWCNRLEASDKSLKLLKLIKVIKAKT